MVNEKIIEAEYFLNEIKTKYPNLDHVKPLFSAFLSASNSIPEHLLFEASMVFKLDLPEDKPWYPKDFKKSALSKQNQKALDFLEFWKKFCSDFEKTEIGNMLKDTRNTDTHKYSQKPHFFAVFAIRDPLEIDDILELEINETKTAGISNLRYVNIVERNKKEFLDEINEKRKPHSKPPVDDYDVVIDIFLTFRDDQKHEVRKTGNQILDKMKELDSEGRKFFN